jgi:Flp pilus assembly protein TadB
MLWSTVGVGGVVLASAPAMSSSVGWVHQLLIGLSTADLAVLQRSRHQHLVTLAAWAGVGGVVPFVVVGGARVIGLIDLSFTVPVGLALLGASVAGAVSMRSMKEQVAAARMSLRHQLTAYVDVVTMLVAGDSGHEGALEQAATVGEGVLFAELRRALREHATRGGAPVDALDATADVFGLDDLRHITAAIALAGTEGAPLVRSLSARASSLRSSLASQQELEARLRTSRLTGPIVGMALVFMVLVIYPALSISP